MSEITNIEEINYDMVSKDLEPEVIKTKKTNKFYPGIYHIFIFDEMGSKQELHFGDNLLKSQHIGRVESKKYDGSYVVTRVCYNSKFKGNLFNGNDDLSKMKYSDEESD